MDLRRRLAHGFAFAYPEEAAAALEGRPVAEVVRVIRALSPSAAGGVVQKMAPGFALRVVEQLESEDATAILAELPLDTAVALIRCADEDTRERLLEALGDDRSRDLRAVLEFPPGTAGAMMDPRAIAVPSDLTVAEARETLQSQAQHALYNVYVVDRDRVLVGVLNLQELLHASSGDRLATILNTAHHRLDVTADRHSVANHPGWRAVYSLPVVDTQGRFLGAVRYRALRRLEEELQDVVPGTGNVTTAALGDLFRTGIVGVMDAFSGGLVSASRKNATPSGLIEVHREESSNEPKAEE